MSASPPITVSVQVSLAGELDLATASALRKLLLGVASAPDLDSLVLDLSGVSFVDATGLEPILAVYAALHARGRVLVLRGVPGVVSRLVELVGETRLLMGHDGVGAGADGSSPTSGAITSGAVAVDGHGTSQGPFRPSSSAGAGSSN